MQKNRYSTKEYSAFYESGVVAVTLRKTIALGTLGLSVSLGLALLGFSKGAVTVAQLAPTPAPAESPLKTDGPSASTPEPVVAEMLKLAGVSRDDTVYDLGSSDGRLVISAVKDYGARRGIGVDTNAGLTRLSNENAQKAGVSDRVQFLQQDLVQTDLSDASVVMLSSLPDINLKLRSKLLSSLKPGTRIVSYSLTMGDWKPDKTVSVPGSATASAPRNLYYWVVPSNISGDWKGRVEYAPGRGQPYTLRFTQQYQQVKGEAIADGKKYTIPNITLIGNRLTFSRSETIQGQQGVIQFNGRIEGDTLKGTAGVKWGILAKNFPIVAQRGQTLQGRAMP
ncbi:MAG: cyclopropane-fatty-acyl-phospholipid synthase family protein [Leptolyngbya sp. BL-A-14]